MYKPGADKGVGWKGFGQAAAALLALALVLAPAWLAPARETLPGPVRAEIIRVHDGDTLILRARIWLGQVISTKVRLAGIDAPELRGRCAREKRMAREARRFVKRKLADGNVTLRDIRFGKYAGRVLARVFTAEGEDLGQALIAAGLARPYRGGRRGRWCQRAERR
ncbi:MAG: thermonuclease family protein [Alphaproteobacteria bacterium]